MPELRSPLGPRRGEERLQVHLSSLTITVSAPKATSDEVRALAMRQREQLDAFIVSRRTLTPEQLETAPRVIELALAAGARLDAPLKATASGAIVQALGEELVDRFGEATVSARGIWYIHSRESREFLLEGSGPAFSVWVEGGEPIGAFSTGTREELLPGRADAVGLVGSSCPILEPAASAAAAMLKRIGDVPRALDFLRGIEGIRGAIIVGGPAVAVFGGIRIDAA